MPSSTSPITAADITWIAPGTPINLNVSAGNTYVSTMKRVRNMPSFSLISDWVLSDPANPASRQVTSDIAGTIQIQVANIGDKGNAPYGNLTWVPLPSLSVNLQTDGYPYLSIFRSAAFNYVQLILTITAGRGVFFSQFSNTEA